jgi:hypothetical protein
MTAAGIFETVGIGDFRAALTPSETALSRLYKLIDDISPFELRRPQGGGPGRDPDEDGEPACDPWDDPALWMLMLH